MLNTYGSSLLYKVILFAVDAIICLPFMQAWKFLQKEVQPVAWLNDAGVSFRVAPSLKLL